MESTTDRRTGKRKGATRTAIVLTGLLLAMVHTYRNRAESGPPRWMEKLETATPWFSFRLGFLLLGFSRPIF
ncbi:GAP family protein [Natrinema caseinilyticum]|uniref:GAP family protein n=1 Tax=Natrinema caseinilyticum TaxID=2961570 RepID=UPI0020C281D5|nr:GAP family protein [Natrinema caseinilyticum]